MNSNKDPVTFFVMNLCSMYIHVFKFLKLHNQLMRATKTKGIFVLFFIWWHVLLCSFDMLGPLLQVVGGYNYRKVYLKFGRFVLSWHLAPGSQEIGSGLTLVRENPHVMELTRQTRGLLSSPLWMDFLPTQWNSMFEKNTFRAAPLMNLGIMSRVPCGVPASFVTGYIREKHCPRDLTLKTPSGRCFCLYSYAYGMWTCTSANSSSVGAWRRMQGFGAWRWLAILWPSLSFFDCSLSTLHPETSIWITLKRPVQ